VPADGHVLVPTPIYHHFKRAVELAPRAHDDVPLVLRAGRWVLDEERLAALVRPGSRLLYLCNPQNPGGTIFTRGELERLAALAARHDLVICSDEIHADLLLDAGKPHVPIASLAPEVSRRTVTLASPNKTFNFPGAGVAWAIVEDAGLRADFSADHHATVHDASLFGYVAALAAYRDGAPWLAAQLDYLRGNRDLVERRVAAMPGLRMAHVEATYLAWIDARATGLADAHAHFLAHGVALSPGAQFGAPGFVRLNFGTQRARLEDALARMASALASTRSR
jgi:bifunctional pyridoxal-dependent enzyme with beta-cystathionase and maltose regulon repressor activities